MATSQYHCQGRCGPNRRSSCCLGGQLWRDPRTKTTFHVHASMMLRVCQHPCSSTGPCRRYNPAAEKGLENLNHLCMIINTIQVCTRVHKLCTLVMFLYPMCTLCTLCTLCAHSVPTGCSVLQFRSPARFSGFVHSLNMPASCSKVLKGPKNISD